MRKCKSPVPANGGANCVGNRTETRSITLCPVNSVFGNWTKYSVCSVSCGGGVQYRMRECDSLPPKYGDENCDGPTSESRSCGEIECPSNLRIFCSH